METFSAWLVLCKRNPPVIGGFHAQRPVTWSFDVFFDLRQSVEQTTDTPVICDELVLIVTVMFFLQHYNYFTRVSWRFTRDRQLDCLFNRLFKLIATKGPVLLTLLKPWRLVDSHHIQLIMRKIFPYYDLSDPECYTLLTNLFTQYCVILERKSIFPNRFKVSHKYNFAIVLKFYRQLDIIVIEGRI